MSECLRETTQIPTQNGIHPLFSDQMNPTVFCDNRSWVQRFRVHVKSDPLIREFRGLPSKFHVTTGGKTRENNLIAYKQVQRKKGNPEP